MKSRFYRSTDNDQLNGWTQKLQSTSLKLSLHQKKDIVTAWWSAAHLIHYGFTNPSETITSNKYVQQIDAINWKLQ